jgi:hypothetical protein
LTVTIGHNHLGQSGRRSSDCHIDGWIAYAKANTIKISRALAALHAALLIIVALNNIVNPAVAIDIGHGNTGGLIGSAAATRKALWWLAIVQNIDAALISGNEIG